MGVARCAQHPAVEALFACDRCGTFACRNCAGPSDQTSLCRKCHALFVATPPSRRARLSLLLATLGFAGLIPGVIGLVLARRELSAIARMEAPLAGEATARMAKNLGWFQVALLFVIGAGLIYRALR